jgi:hypothetical protein
MKSFSIQDAKQGQTKDYYKELGHLLSLCNCYISPQKRMNRFVLGVFFIDETGTKKNQKANVQISTILGVTQKSIRPKRGST